MTVKKEETWDQGSSKRKVELDCEPDAGNAGE